MKKIAFSLLAVLGFAGYSFAGQEVSSKEYKAPVETTPCFKDQELQFDIFGTYNPATSGGNHYFHNGGWGGGVGVNYFFARYFGVGVQGDWATYGHANTRGGNIDDDVISSANASFILRYPLELAGHICLAPYVFAGGGGKFDGHSTGEGHVGLGLEYRATQHVGLFTDGRYNFNEGYNVQDNAQVRAGVRLAF